MSSGTENAINARILYWGIEGAGKTTNLESIRAKLRSDHSGELRREPTRIDPTVTYEILPIQLGDIGGRPTQIEIVVVPDGEEQAPTRKQLLDEVSGVVLVIDSQPGREEANIASRNELADALASYGRELTDIPVILQYNKRDLADDNQIEVLHRKIALPSAAVFEAIATETTGVLQTLTTISKRVVKNLRDKNAAQETAPEPPVEFQAEVPSEVQSQTGPEAAPQIEEIPTPAEELAGSSAPIYDPAALEQSAHTSLSTTAMLESAMEADIAETIELDELADRAPDALDLGTSAAFNSSYEDLSSADKPNTGLRLGANLRIVSVGTASRDGERSVRIPLVLGDAEGETASIALTISLEPLLDNDGSDNKGGA
jgi:signal recognition particle receptor subunit beta